MASPGDCSLPRCPLRLWPVTVTGLKGQTKAGLPLGPVPWAVRLPAERSPTAWSPTQTPASVPVLDQMVVVPALCLRKRRPRGGRSLTLEHSDVKCETKI